MNVLGVEMSLVAAPERPEFAIAFGAELSATPTAPRRVQHHRVGPGVRAAQPDVAGRRIDVDSFYVQKIVTLA